MEKKIKLDSKTSITVNNNVGWLFVYREQFGKDIVPTLIPILNAGIDLVANLYKQTGGKFTPETLAGIDTDAVTDALYSAAGLEMVDIIDIVWALAKNADDSIEEPREWVRQFDAFPVDIIGPAVFELVFKSMVSTKNWKRLQNLRESLQPKSTSTK